MFNLYLLVALQLLIIILSVIDIVYCIEISDSIRKCKRFYRLIVDRGYGYYLAWKLSRSNLFKDSLSLSRIERLLEGYIDSHTTMTKFTRENIENKNVLILLSGAPAKDSIAIKIALLVQEFNIKAACIFYGKIANDTDRRTLESRYIELIETEYEPVIDREVYRILKNSLFACIIIVSIQQKYRAYRDLFDLILPVVVVNSSADAQQLHSTDQISYSHTIKIKDSDREFMSIITNQSNSIFNYPYLNTLSEIYIMNKEMMINVIKRIIKAEINKIV